jgi:thiamine-phosphate pyrophosphorylase
MAENFKIIVITSEKDIAGEHLLIASLFESGLQTLHLRKPDYTILKTRDLLNSIPEIFYPKIVIHNHYELLNDFNLKGANLSESIRIEGKTDGIKNIISSSFHRLDHILSSRFPFEYVFFSPVFQSISKQGYKPSITQQILKDFFKSKRSQIKFPIIALGGVTDKNILLAKEIGFSGAACIGYIWESSNPMEQLKKLQKIVQG